MTKLKCLISFVLGIAAVFGYVIVEDELERRKA